MPTEPSPSERRIEELDREAFERAVIAATKAATQEVAKIHRVRLVTQSAIASFLTALAVAAVIALVLGHNQKQADFNHSLSNCRLVKQLSQPLADFVASDADLRKQETQIALKDRKYAAAINKLFGKSEVAKLEAQGAKIDQKAVNYWNASVVTRLEAVAGANCVARLR